MMYHIARSGQTFGPYTEPEIRQYIASGNIGLADLVQVEGSGQWVPVVSLFPLSGLPPAPAVTSVAGPTVLYPDPPDFPWWAALLLGLVTGGLFFVIWDIVEAGWLKRIDRNSSALLWYIGVAVLYLFKVPSMWSTVNFNVFGGARVLHNGGVFGSVGFAIAIVARFVFRRELLEHFRTREGIRLDLNGFWTLILGGLYFQFKFNQINERKRATNSSVPVL